MPVAPPKLTKIEPLSRGPKLPERQQSEAEKLFREMEEGVRRLEHIAIRRATGSSRCVRIYGPRYADPKSAFWKNEDAYTVGVCVVVTCAGPIGSSMTVHGVKYPADMIGNRSALHSLDLNESLKVLFSDASIEAELVIYTPTRPIHP